jgi:hypothetical protein
MGIACYIQGEEEYIRGFGEEARRKETSKKTWTQMEG